MRFLRPVFPGVGFVRGVVVGDGDSLMSGNGLPPWQTYFGVALATLNAAGGFYLGQSFNMGVPSQTVATMTTNAPANIDPKFKTNPTNAVRLMVGGFGNLLVADGGINDIILVGVDAATAISRIRAYHQARVSAGWRTVAITITYDGLVPAKNSLIDTVNADIRANQSLYGYTALADVASVPQAMDPNDTTYYDNADKLHYKPALHQILGAGVVQTAMRAAILA